jgi:hypothetical protein
MVVGVNKKIKECPQEKIITLKTVAGYRVKKFNN